MPHVSTSGVGDDAPDGVGFMEQRENAGTSASAESAGDTKNERSRGIDWSDPKVLAGNAPPMARWPLVLAGFAWFGGIAFLAVMAISRLRTDTF